MLLCRVPLKWMSVVKKPTHSNQCVHVDSIADTQKTHRLLGIYGQFLNIQWFE